MRVVIGNVAYPGIDANNVTYKGTTADPVPTCSVALKDDTSSIAITEMMELLILDENVIPNPTWNFLKNPSMNPYTTSWNQGGTVSGITLSQPGGGGITYTFSNAANGSNRYEYQFLPPNLLVGGQTYTVSFYAQASSPVHLQTVGFVKAVDAANNLLQEFDFTFPVSTSLTRYSFTFTAPAGTSFGDFVFSASPTNATNSGSVTYTQVQYEPQWFPTISYPTPWCGPAQTNCRQLPNGWWIRQYRKFGGFVNHAIASDYHGNARTWHIDAVGYGWILSMVTTATSFSSTDDATIIQALISSSFPTQADGSSLFDTSTNVVTGASVSNLQPNWDDLRTVINGLSSLAGFYWLVDPYWSLIYQPPGYTQMPIQLIADNSENPDFVTEFTIYNFKAEMDFTQPGSIVLVIGGSCSTQLTTKLSNGVGVSQFNCQALLTPIANGTTIYVGGNQSIAITALAHVGATSIFVGSFTPNADYGVGTTITTNPYVGIVNDPVRSNTLNQALWSLGTANNAFLRKVNDSSLQSVADVNSRGIAEVIQYDNARYIYHGTTNQELIVGQAIQITSNTDNLNASSLLIQQVQATWIGKNELLQDMWEYAVDLGAVNRSASSIMSHIFRNTTRNTSPPSINQLSFVALEKFGVVETLNPTIYTNLIMAWIYPGSTLIGGVSHVPVEYSDGRIIHVLKPQYYHLDATGVLVQDTVVSSGVDGYTAANAAGVKANSAYQYVTISGSAPGIGVLAASNTLLNNFNNTLIAFLGTVGFTGIEMDLEESWSPGAGGVAHFADIKTIANSLGTALHAAGYKLMVTGPAISTALQGAYAWKWSDFEHMPVDYLCPQAYDHFYDTNGLGDPGAPLAWITDICQHIKIGITDKSRIVIGLNSHGWHGTTAGFVATYDDYVQSQALPGFGTATRDAASGELMWVNAGISYNYSDTLTLNGKRTTVYATGLTNISVWHLGGNNQWFSP